MLTAALPPASLTTVPQLSPAVAETLRLAVVWGGPSHEAEVSHRSALNIHQALLRLGYNQAYLLEANSALTQHLISHPPHGVVNAMHGEVGEDGVLQGLLTWLNLPFSGNGLRASAVTMDKALTKRLMAQAGLPVAADVLVTQQQLAQQAHDAQALAETLLPKLTFPLMVKPLSLGSSVGMSKVLTPEALPAALQQGLAAEATVLLEPFFSGLDVTVGVLAWPDGVHRPTPVLALSVADGWYDYEAKYTKGKTQFDVPAPLSPEVTQALQQAALTAHQATGCSVVSRTDMVVAPSGDFIVLEVNSNPGMTDLSDLPAQAAAMGLSYDDVVTLMIAPMVQQVLARSAVGH
jgi:D-alanine-D-alanine ligase